MIVEEGNVVGTVDSWVCSSVTLVPGTVVAEDGSTVVVENKLTIVESNESVHSENVVVVCSVVVVGGREVVDETTSLLGNSVVEVTGTEVESLAC